jgi:predicted transcriptional regulator
MATLSAKLPDELAEAVHFLAQREGRAKSQLIREALEAYLAHQREIDQLTLEGLSAMRSGDVVEHDEIVNDLQQWGR